jgi:hypothetical protein
MWVVLVTTFSWSKFRILINGYNSWFLLTHSRSWALLEKPPNVQPLKNFPAFYGNRRFITVFTRAVHWSLSWVRSIQSISSHPISVRSILGHLCKESVQVQGFLWSYITSLFFMVRSCLPHAQTPSWRSTPCWLFMRAYLIHSQLPSIIGGRLFHPQPEDTPCRGDKRPT